MINIGVNLMMMTTMRLVRRRSDAPTSLRIRDVAEEEKDEENNADDDGQDAAS
jgi:hypothetical protein